MFRNKFKSMKSFLTALLIIIIWYASAWAQVKITANDGAPLDRFGDTVAISGDYAVIGAPVPVQDPSDKKPGAAYIFYSNGSNWTQMAKLTASDGKPDDYFGNRVAISGNRAIMAARFGSYIFEYDGSSWKQQAKLRGAWRYGMGVAISGDYALVEGGNVFRYDGADWIQEAKLDTGDGVYNGFGCSASVSGDYIIIGAYTDSQKGAAYIFKRQGTQWILKAKLTAADGKQGDAFGYNVSVSGDYALVGAPQHAGVPFGNGCAYVFRRIGDNWTQQAKLTASNGKSGDNFGRSVSISGEYAVVGVSDEVNYAYVFKRPTNGWTSMTETTRLTHSASTFGEAVATDGIHAVIGARGENRATGAAFIYDVTITYHLISGYVRDHNNRPVPGTVVTFSNGGGETRTNSVGYYRHVVERGWTGVARASKDGYKSTPVGIEPISSDRPNTDIAIRPRPTGLGASSVIRRTSWDTSYGNRGGESCQKWEGRCYDPIETSTGGQVLQYDLLTVQGVIPITFRLAYNSLIPDKGPAGRGWTYDFGFGARLEELSSGNILVRWSPTRDNKFFPKGNGEYYATELACKNDKLLKNSDSTFTLTREDKSVYHFNVSGQLAELGTEKGQVLNFTYNNGRLSRITEPVSGGYLDYAYNSDGLLETVTDPLGRQVKLEYNASHDLITITNADGHDLRFTYNEKGQTLTGVDAEGRQLFRNTYDEEGRIIAQDDGRDDTLPAKFMYDEDSEPGELTTTVTDREGNTRVFTYGEDYLMLSKQDELGNTSAEYGYDEKGNRISAKDANGNTTSFGYDADGNVVSVTDSNDNITNMAYDESRNLTSLKNALGKKRAFVYDEHNNLIRSTDSENNETQFEYNENGQIWKITTPLGHVTTYEYENGLPARAIDPEGDIRTFAYDAAGRPISFADSEGNAYTIIYNEACGSACRAESVEDPLGNKVHMSYDSRGNLLSFTDARGNITQYEYDKNGNLITLTNALTHKTHYAYDGEDRLIRITDPRGNAVQLEYDAKGRVVKITDPLGNTRETSYDKTYNVKTRKDAFGRRVVSYDYDVLDNLVGIADALQNKTVFDYDKLSRVVKISDPLNRMTQFGYDDLNRLVSVIDALGGQSSQGFDKDGNLTGITDPNTNQTIFGFDKNGRLTSETLATGDGVHYTYNARELLERVKNARAQERVFQYDEAGRITSWTDPDGTVSYTYDENGNVLTVTDADGTITRKYDELNRVTEYTDARGNIIRYDYDEVGNLVMLTYPDNKKVNYAYDEADRLIKVTDWAGRETIYEYDKNSRLVKTVRANGTVMTRDYNDAGQLVQQKDVKPNGGVIVQYDFTYDDAGNITEEKVTPDPGYVPILPVAMSYDTANRLKMYQNELVTHDADGNMIRGPLDGAMADFVFDSRNRLVHAGTTGYTYDAENNRIAVNENGKETQYVINLEAYLSQVLVRKEGDGTQGFYVYGLGLIGEEKAGEYLTYHFDLRGSTVALSDESGNVGDEFQYSPFGGLAKHVGANETVFLYNGRDGVMTDGNGLYYMRARYYNPAVRRFVNQDVLLGSVVNGQSLNRYAYVRNNPIIFIDPTGLELRIYSSDAFIDYPPFSWIGWSPFNHAILRDSKTGKSAGRSTLLGTKGWWGENSYYDESVYNDDYFEGLPYNVVDTTGYSEKAIMDYFVRHKEKGSYFPIVNDCFTSVDHTLNDWGLESPGAPEGRLKDGHRKAYTYTYPTTIGKNFEIYDNHMEFQLDDSMLESTKLYTGGGYLADWNYTGSGSGAWNWY